MVFWYILCGSTYSYIVYYNFPRKWIDDHLAQKQVLTMAHLKMPKALLRPERVTQRWEAFGWSLQQQQQRRRRRQQQPQPQAQPQPASQPASQPTSEPANQATNQLNNIFCMFPVNISLNNRSNYVATRTLRPRRWRLGAPLAWRSARSCATSLRSLSTSSA